MQTLLMNARYKHRVPTGVDRVAQQLIAALEQNLDFRQRYQIRSVAPKRRLPAAAAHLWEQTQLARTSPDNLLLSLCNTGPILRRNQIVMIHDAQVHLTPQSYAPLFRNAYRMAQPVLARHAAAVLTVSEFSKAQLVRFGIAPEQSISVVPNGGDHILCYSADTSILQRHGLTPRRFFIAFGSAAPHKNIDMLRRAAIARCDTTYPLVIIGGDETSVAEKSRLSDHGVKIIGRATDPELRALYENACAFALPSLTEGFGLPAAEAMFCGCPVVSTTAGAVPEVCGTATLTCDPKDEKGWTEAMETLAHKPALAQNLSDAGRLQVAQFTWSNAAQKLLAVIDKVHRVNPTAQTQPVRHSSDDQRFPAR